MSSNQFPYPEDFSHADWTKARLSATANVLAAPDGQTTADKLQETADTGTHGIYDGATYVAGLAYTFSVYAKRAERSAIRLTLPDNRFPADVYANFNLASGTVNYASNCTATIAAAGDDWYRCSITATSNVSGAASPVIYVLQSVSTSSSYAGDAGYGVYVWGAKIEQSSSPQPYQPVSPYIGWLDETTPEEKTVSGTGAYLYLGDNELRALKSAAKLTFPNIAGSVSASPSEFNAVLGLESDWVTQLSGKAVTTHNHDGESIGVVTLGDGSRATTQVAGDNSTKVATTAYAKLAIAGAGLGSAWTTVATLTAASSTAVTFSATSLYDHYRILSRDLQTHGTGNLELEFGSDAGWVLTSDYAWGVVTAGMTATASSTSVSGQIEVDGAQNFGGGATSLDMRLFWPPGEVSKKLTWRLTGLRSGSYVAICGGGHIRPRISTLNKIRLMFASGASFTGSFVFIGRKR